MTYQCKQVDIGNKCVECLRSTSFGTGLFVNRIPADNDKYLGWLCPECNFHECDRCDEKIYNELSIPSIDKANKLAEYKAFVEFQIEESMKDMEKLPIGEKIDIFSKITKLKKELRKL